MSRFYFHYRNDLEYIEDEEGLELEDASAAWTKGIECIRDVLAGDLIQGMLRTSTRIEITDETNRPLMTVGFEEAVSVQS